MRKLGIIIDFVLVVDVIDVLDDMVIGDWLFGLDLVMVIVYVGVYVQGLCDVGVLLVFKYFFGYGCGLGDLYNGGVMILLFDDLVGDDLVFY